MTKQINLVSEDLLPGYGRAQIPSFITVIILALTCASIMIFSAYHNRSTRIADQALWQQKSITEKQKLAHFQNVNPNIQNQAQLERLNAELSEQLNQRRTTLLDLANQLENAIDGFSLPLNELFAYQVDGVSLESVQLREGKRSFNLTGTASAPELVPQYLTLLGESKFQGMSVQQLNIEKEPNQNVWRFGLGNDDRYDLLEAQR